jgi:hypothetical protein
MDRQMILVHLAAASRHAVQCEQHVARQRELVEQMERRGQDSSLAKQTLQQFEASLAMHVADRDRLEKQLAETSR